MVKPVAGYRPSYSSPEPVQPTGTVAENAMRFPPLAHRAAADHKLHSTRQQHEMKLISGNGETSSRLPAFSLFLPGTCPNNRDRRMTEREAALYQAPFEYLKVKVKPFRDNNNRERRRRMWWQH